MVSRRSIPGQHSLQHSTAFDEPMLERPRDMERDDCADQNLANEMPDENAVWQRLIPASNGGKVEEPEDADRVAVGVGPAQQSTVIMHSRT